MATLEKIRSKSVLLLIVIGVALLAFIIGDFFKITSLFGQDTTVIAAKEAGVKVDYREYEAARQNNKSEGSTPNQIAMIEQLTLQQELLEKLEEKEYDDLGLTVTDEELQAFLNNKQHPNAADMLASQFATGGRQLVTVPQLYSLANTPQPNMTQEEIAQNKDLWIRFEEQARKYLLQAKFSEMLFGSLVANKVDAEQLYNDFNTTYTVAMAQAPYASLPNADFNVTDAELQKAWEERKQYYAVSEPTRRVTVINVPISYSVEDETEARKLMASMVEQLNIQPELTALKGQKDFSSTRATVTAELIEQAIKNGENAMLRELADTAMIGTTVLLSQTGDTYSMAKVFNVFNAADSVNISMVGFDAQKFTADSIIAQLKSGELNIDSIGMKDDMFALTDLDFSVYAPVPAGQNTPDQFAASDINAYRSLFQDKALGEYFVADTLGTHPEFGTVYVVNSRQAPTKIVDFAQITYKLRPSQATVDKLKADLEAYIKANGTADKFAANAYQSNYNPITTNITASTPFIALIGPNGNIAADIPNSAELVNWALKAQAGEVSHVFGSPLKGNFAVVAVNNIYENFLEISDPTVKNELTERIRAQKKGDALVAKYKDGATSIGGYATKMGVTADSLSINFGYENRGAELMAGIATAPIDQLSAPTKGNSGVAVYKVINVEKPARPFNFKTDSEMFVNYRINAMFQPKSEFQPNPILPLLLGKAKIENTLYKFTSHEE